MDISVIIPVYNDPQGLVDTLDAVVEQTYPEERYEVLVVDNDSDDETPEIASAYAEQYSNVSLLVENRIQGSYAARNTGIEHATGEILAFIDADVVVGQDWLQVGTRVMEEQGLDYLGCHVELFIPDGKSTVAARYNRRTAFPVQQYIRDDHFAPTCGLFVRKSVIDDVGLFNAELISGGDLEFGNRVYDAGYGLGYDPELTVYHPARTSFREIFKKSFRVGIGSAQLGQQYPERYGHHATVNPLRLSLRVIRSFFQNSDNSKTSERTQTEGQADDSLRSSITRRILFVVVGFVSNVLYFLGRVRGVYTYSRATRK